MSRLTIEGYAPFAADEWIDRVRASTLGHLAATDSLRLPGGEWFLEAGPLPTGWLGIAQSVVRSDDDADTLARSRSVVRAYTPKLRTRQAVLEATFAGLQVIGLGLELGVRALATEPAGGRRPRDAWRESVRAPDPWQAIGAFIQVRRTPEGLATEGLGQLQLKEIAVHGTGATHAVVRAALDAQLSDPRLAGGTRLEVDGGTWVLHAEAARWRVEEG